MAQGACIVAREGARGGDVKGPHQRVVSHRVVVVCGLRGRGGVGCAGLGDEFHGEDALLDGTARVDRELKDLVVRHVLRTGLLFLLVICRVVVGSNI